MMPQNSQTDNKIFKKNSALSPGIGLPGLPPQFQDAAYWFAVVMTRASGLAVSAQDQLHSPETKAFDAAERHQALRDVENEPRLTLELNLK